MADTTNDQAPDTTAPATDQAPAAPATGATVRKLYATRAECEASKTTETAKNAKPFEVTVNSVSRGWILAGNADLAVAYTARMDGYAASAGNKTAPVTKEVIAGALAKMSPEDRAALIAQYVPAPAPAPAPTPTGRGRGKQ